MVSLPLMHANNYEYELFCENVKILDGRNMKKFGRLCTSLSLELCINNHIYRNQLSLLTPMGKGQTTTRSEINREVKNIKINFQTTITQLWTTNQILSQ